MPVLLCEPASHGLLSRMGETHFTGAGLFRDAFAVFQFQEFSIHSQSRFGFQVSACFVLEPTRHIC